MVIARLRGSALAGGWSRGSGDTHWVRVDSCRGEDCWVWSAGVPFDALLLSIRAVSGARVPREARRAGRPDSSRT